MRIFLCGLVATIAVTGCSENSGDARLPACIGGVFEGVSELADYDWDCTDTSGYPVIELIDPGSGDPETLRFQPVAGRPLTMETTLAQRVDLSVDDEQQSFSVETTLVAAVEVLASHESWYLQRSTFEDITVNSVDSPDSAMSSDLQDLMDELIGMEMFFVTTSQGFVVATAAEQFDVFDSLGLDFSEILGGSAGNLPAEPIGVGAVWTATTSTAADEIDIDTVTTYTLETLDGNLLEWSAVIEQSADQTLGAATMELKSEGGGRSALDLSSIAVDGTSQIVTTVEASETIDGVTHLFRQVTSMEMQIATGP